MTARTEQDPFDALDDRYAAFDARLEAAIEALAAEWRQEHPHG